MPSKQNGYITLTDKDGIQVWPELDNERW